MAAVTGGRVGQRVLGRAWSPRSCPGARSVPAAELRVAARRADDRERLIGFVAAPLASGIGIIVVTALLAGDPAALLTDGRPDRLHVNPAVYHELFYVLMSLAVAMLATAFVRRRLFLGMAMALYGLALFNLHYWGFGLPFLMGGSWLLVRSYRANRAYRDASATPAQPSGRPAGR
jgi:hypothetical protein